MDFSKKNILVLTDGSEGMISQVMGLAKQISLNINSIETSIFFPWNKLQPGFLPVFKWIFKNNLKIPVVPDIIISCGRKSVYLSIYLNSPSPLGGVPGSSLSPGSLREVFVIHSYLNPV